MQCVKTSNFPNEVAHTVNPTHCPGTVSGKVSERRAVFRACWRLALTTASTSEGVSQSLWQQIKVSLNIRRHHLNFQAVTNEHPIQLMRNYAIKKKLPAALCFQEIYYAILKMLQKCDKSRTQNEKMNKGCFAWVNLQVIVHLRICRDNIWDIFFPSTDFIDEKKAEKHRL